MNILIQITKRLELNTNPFRLGVYGGPDGN
jgi:hypothetical protein